MTSEYLGKNPMYIVPVLKDGEFVLTESHAIITYLVSKYGIPDQREKFYPSDLKIRATINQRMFFETANVFSATRHIVYDLIAGKKAQTEKQIETINDAYSILEKRLNCFGFTVYKY